VLTEEHLIDEPPHDGKMKITEIYLTPKAKANPEALEAIRYADLIVLGPGDLYTSLIPNLLVEGISAAIRRSRAKKAYVMNLMTKYGQTYDYTARDHLKVLERYLGTRPTHVIVNTSKFAPEALALYAESFERRSLTILTEHRNTGSSVHRLASKQLVKKNKSDELVRSLIRHDSDKLGAALTGILENTV